MALGSWWEARRSYRVAVEEDRAAEEAHRVDTQVAHSSEERRIRRETVGRYPTVDQWMANPLWRPHSSGQPGSADVATLRLGLDRVEHSGQWIAGLPHVIDISRGVAVVGEGPHATAVFRAVVVQALALWCSQDQDRNVHLLWSNDTENLSPGEPPKSLELPGLVGQETGIITHSRGVSVCCEQVATRGEVNPQIHTVVVVNGPDEAQVYRDGQRIDQALRPDLLGAPGALWAIRRIDQWRRVEPEVRREVGSSEDRSGLWFSLDDQHSHNLATDGPHALVWGQTGRGKTILLQRLLLDAAKRYTPEQFSCVLIDFKGGAGALGLQGLDHLAGVLTDLEPDSLRRVHTGLVAEIARRETLLAQHAVADISQLPAEVICPRSIIAIDEIALLVQREPGFVDLLADIAARGRSLGLHLVISGQRMTSQVPRGVIVNAGLRFCLGVTDPMEARDYLPGVPEATLRHLHSTPPGTTLALTLGESPYTSQVVALGPPTSTRHRAARLWSESLPDVVAPTKGELGLVEQADKQRLAPWTLDDIAPGVVVLVGDVGSGVGEAMARVVQCASLSEIPLFLPDEPAALFDALDVVINCSAQQSPRRAVSGGAPPQMPSGGVPLQVCAPRIDRVWAGCSEQVQAQLAERLVSAGEALADLPQPGRLLVSSRPGCGLIRPLIRGGAELITLRVSHPEHRDQWGVDRRHVSPHAPPGRGLWRDQPIHWARPDGGLVEHATSSGATTLLSRPTLDDALTAQRGGVLVFAEESEASTVHAFTAGRLEQAGWSSTPAHTVFSGGLDGALGGAGVILWGLSAPQMRHAVGHERAPCVSPPPSQAWWVRRQGTRLIDWC